MIAVIIAIVITALFVSIYWQKIFPSAFNKTAEINNTNEASNNSTSSDNISDETVNSTEGWKSFSRNGISLKYPSNWAILDNEFPESHIFTNYFGNQEIELDRTSPQSGFIGFTLVFFENDYNTGITGDVGTSEFVTSSTDLAYFLKEMNGLLNKSAAQETMQIGGVESIRLVWEDITTPWAIKGNNGIYTFNYIVATDVEKSDAEKSVNQILATVEFIHI